MQKFRLKCLFVFFGVVSPIVHAKMKIDEQALIDLYHKAKSTSYLSREARLEGAKTRQLDYEQNFDITANSTLGYSHSQEDLLPFSFLSENSYVASVGLKKQHSYGFESGFEYSVTRLDLGKYSDNSINSPTRLYIPHAKFQIAMSLWKNFLGSFDNLLKEELSHDLKLTELRNAIEKTHLENRIREFFWRYVYLEKSEKIRKELLQSSQSQGQELLQRKEQAVADKADLERNRATILQRKYELSSITMTKLEILKAIQDLLGESKEPPKFEIIADIDNPDIQNCTMKIDSEMAANRTWTNKSKLYEVLESHSRIQIEKIREEQGFELQLSGFLEGKGIDDKLRGSVNESLSLTKSNYGILLSLSSPVGGSLKNLKSSKIRKTKLELEKELRTIRAESSSLHSFSVKTFAQQESDLLKIVEAKEAMKSSLHEQKIKYEQGRLDYLSYIQEEEALSQIEMQILSLKISRILTLIHYFAFFDQTPCKFNYTNTRR